MPQLDLRILGVPAITWLDEPFSLPRRQARALLFRLAEEMGRVSRAELALLLWPETADTPARRNLTRLLSYTRRALPDPELIRPGRDTVALNPELVRSDAARFRRLVADSETGAMAEAIALYRGSFLAGFDLPDSAEFDSWLSDRRRHYERRYLGALSDLVEAETAAGKHEAAIRYARQYLATDDIAEAIHRRLITLYHWSGDRSAALRQFERCAVILERELGVAPLPETRAAYEAAREGTRATATAVPTPEPAWATLPGLDLPLLGRETAWQEVETAYRRLGEGGVVFIGGEAGVGKSRLMQEFAEAQARADETLLLLGHGGPQALPYGPLVAALRLALSHPALGAGVRPIWLAETARLLPELNDRFPDLPPPVDVQPEQAQTRLFTALAEVFLNLAPAARPLLCLDDVHWADGATLGWLQYIVGRLAGSGLRILATYRTHEAEPLGQWRRELARAQLMAEVVLGGLSPEAVMTILRQAGGKVAEPELLAGRIHAATGGNAFFVLEVVRELLESDALADDDPDLPLPQTVADTVLRRAGRLRPLSQQLLEIAAVLSPHLALETIVDVSGRGEMEVVEGVHALVGGQLLTAEADQFRFHHELAREAVICNISSWRRRLLHRRAAETLAELTPRKDGELTAVIAAHFAAAGEPVKAVTYYRQAAAMATDVYAHREAIGYLERAVELARAEAAAAAVLPGLQETLADSLTIAGEFAAAAAQYRAALEGVPEDDALLRAELQCKLASTLPPQQRAEEAEAIYRTALARLEEPPSTGVRRWQGVRLNIFLGLLDALYFQLQAKSMAKLRAQTKALLDAVGTPEEHARFYSRLDQMAFIQHRYCVPAENVALAQRALVFAEKSGNPPLIARQQFHLGFHLLWHGDRVEAEEILQQALVGAQSAADTWLQNQCLVYLSIAYRLRGEVGQARSLLPQLTALSREIGNTMYVGVCQANSAWLHYRDGEWSRARRRADAALETWAETAYPLQWLAHWLLLAIALKQGQLPDTLAAARAMLESDQQQLPQEIESALAAGVAAWESGDSESVRANLGRARALAQEQGYL